MLNPLHTIYKLVVFSLLLTAVVHGQQAEDAEAFRLNDTVAAPEQAPLQEFHFETGQTRTLNVSFDVPKAFLENPDLVAIEPKSPKQLSLTAMKPGVTNLNLWDANQSVYVFKIVITGKLSKLHELFIEEFPSAQLSLKKLSGSLLISGNVDDREQISQIEAIGREYFPRIVSNIRIRQTQPKEIAPTGDSLSYEELRARLPEEVTDDIVVILAESPQALVDFAEIQTQTDVDEFNMKYGVNLSLPSGA